MQFITVTANDGHYNGKDHWKQVRLNIAYIGAWEDHLGTEVRDGKAYGIPDGSIIRMAGMKDDPSVYITRERVSEIDRLIRVASKTKDRQAVRAVA